jgi:hypothetical protein
MEILENLMGRVKTRKKLMEVQANTAVVPTERPVSITLDTGSRPMEGILVICSSTPDLERDTPDLQTMGRKGRDQDPGSSLTMEIPDTSRLIMEIPDIGQLIMEIPDTDRLIMEIPNINRQIMEILGTLQPTMGILDTNNPVMEIQGITMEKLVTSSSTQLATYLQDNRGTTSPPQATTLSLTTRAATTLDPSIALG